MSNADPKVVPFLPDDHPYFLAYHFPAMTRCDPKHYKRGYENHIRSAKTRERYRVREM